MSLQVFLQARLTGTERFLVESSGDLVLRTRWVSLLSEILPRALLAELGLAQLLLGTSGGDQFLVVLPRESVPPANEFLGRAAAAIADATSGYVRLVWTSTENLGDWSDIRKRLHEQMAVALATPLAANSGVFAPYARAANPEAVLFRGVPGRESQQGGWSPDEPARIDFEGGKHVWNLAPASDGISFARHVALADNGNTPAPLTKLASRARGRRTWGVLRGDVDSYEVRLNRAQTVEEHIQLSLMYKQFFANELEMLCSMPEFFRKITLLYSGGDDFALFGSWDALIPFARELQRLFHRFVEANVRELAGTEGKTLSMGLAIARETGDSLTSLYRDAGESLDLAKASGKDCFYLFGRTLEWNKLNDADETRATMTRMVGEFGCSPAFLYELASFYRGGTGDARRGRNIRLERPWRFHRRLNRVINASVGMARNKDFQRLRTELITDFTGRNAAQVRLRPAGRVALEWARLETEA
jgi:CRISPR-associated protein Csm1